MGKYTLYRQLRPGPGKGRSEVVANQRARVTAATIEIVAERGYDHTTVSDIVRLAGVSKASFYELFSGKDECFVATWDTALRAAASAVLSAERDAGVGRDRLRADLFALAKLIAAEPKGAKLLLIDGLGSTPEIRRHICRRFGLLEVLVHERLSAAGRGDLPHPLVAGIVRGIEHHARRCVGAGCPERLLGLVDPLLDWGLAFDGVLAAPTSSVPAAPIRSDKQGKDLRPVSPTFGDTRDLLLVATVRLAASESYDALTPSRIRRTAGVSRRSFDANFKDVGDCFLNAVRTELAAIAAKASQAISADMDWAERTCLILERSASSLAAAPDLARLAFVETIEAAPTSLFWRQGMIAELAVSLYQGAPTDLRPSPVAAEATAAALWGAVSDSVHGGALHLLPARAPQLGYLTLVPALGAEAAAEVIAGTWRLTEDLAATAG